ncbi:MAG: HDOD domain-containing protein [Sandaracinaceae bacterium]
MSLRHRITARHAIRTSALLDDLLRASRQPDEAFAILEDVASAHPDLEARILFAANTAGRRAYGRITTVRQALVRIGLVSASEVLLEALERVEPMQPLTLAAA